MGQTAYHFINIQHSEGCQMRCGHDILRGSQPVSRRADVKMGCWAAVPIRSRSTVQEREAKVSSIKPSSYKAHGLRIAAVMREVGN
jgi:hypothetical protein